MIKNKLLKLTTIVITFSLLASFLTPFALAAKPTTPRVRIKPDIRKPGDYIKIHGMRFTPIAGTEITLKLYNEYGDCIELREFETDKNGKFRGTFIVPAVNLGDYILSVQDSYGLTVNVSLRVDPYIS